MESINKGDVVHRTTNCRGCGKVLSGDGSQGNSVYDPDTKKYAKWNYYGGWVCSKTCDYESSLELERSMPGHIGQRSLNFGSEAYKSVQRNWPDQ